MVGYNSRNKNKLPKKYLCPSCSFILQDPIQLMCGHRHCESCLTDQDKMVIKCAQCSEETLRNDMFYDRGMKNDMEILNINCFHCQWNGLFRNYQDHLTKCYLKRSMNPVLQVRRLVKNFNEYNKNLQLLKELMKRISINTSPYKMSIEEEILQQNDNLFISYEGTLVIKIDNILSKLNNNKCIITSPSFYTSPGGYKFCIRIYLNGNGIGQSTHISIFLIIMRGDYDGIVEWPFNCQVIFSLYDLINRKQHIIEAIQCDGTSISSQRPHTPMNIAAGIPKFIPLSKIQQDNSPYICGGSIYIKAMIRKEPIPISILPNIMNIDPGLPIYMQEEMIENEIKKNKMSLLKLHLTLKSK